MGLTVKITKNDLSSYEQRGLRAAAAAAMAACEEGAAVSRAAAPRDTGALAGSISAQKEGDEYGIVAAAPYALFQEVGTSRGVTGRHFIREGLDAARDAWPSKVRI